MKDTKSDKYIHKPLKIIQDKRLTAREQDYLCLIASLQSKQGCSASNRYFAEYFGVSSSRAAEVIRSLKKKKFIKTNMEKKGRRTLKRTISVTDTDSRTALEIAGKKSPVRGGKKSPAKVVRIPRTGGKESPVRGGKESPYPIINNNTKYNNKEIEGAFTKGFTLKEVEDMAFTCGVSQEDAMKFISPMLIKRLLKFHHSRCHFERSASYTPACPESLALILHLQQTEHNAKKHLPDHLPEGSLRTKQQPYLTSFRVRPSRIEPMPFIARCRSLKLSW